MSQTAQGINLLENVQSDDLIITNDLIGVGCPTSSVEAAPTVVSEHIAGTSYTLRPTYSPSLS